MTQEQAEEIIAAFKNVEDLVVEEDFTKLIKEVIAILTGSASELEEEMARPKGSSNKKKNGTSTEVAPVPTSVAVPEDRTQLISEWKAAADQLAEVKAKEASLRQAIVAQMFDGTKLEGSETVDIGWGYQLRVKKELAYNASNKDGEVKKLEEALSKRDPSIQLIRWKPDVAKVVYREVLALAQKYQDNEVLELLHAAIELKPGMPQLEMVPPKQDEPTQPIPVEATFTLEENFVPE